MDTPEDQDVVQTFESLSERFMQLREFRMHQTPQEDMFNFLGDNVISSMMDCLADMANWCDKQFIKLALLEQELYQEVKAKVEGEEDNVGMGLGAFKQSSQAWKDGQA